MRARSPSFLERRTLAKDRALVQRLLGPAGRLERDARDLPKLQRLLAAPLTEHALIGLGTAFGDVLASELGLTWVLATDDLGSDHALQAKPQQVFVFPRSMLVKRIMRGEQAATIDLAFMLAEVSNTVTERSPGAATDEP